MTPRHPSSCQWHTILSLDFDPHPHYISPHLVHRGALHEASLRRDEPERRWRCGATPPVAGDNPAGAAPARPARNRSPGRLRQPALGVLRPLCEELANGPADSPGCASAGRSRGIAEERCQEPQQGAERRAGLRHWPVISGDPEMGSTARRALGCGVSAPAPVGALLPLIFSTGAEDRQGAPAPSSTGRRSVGFRQDAQARPR